jgi:uncharacterized protein YggE
MELEATEPDYEKTMRRGAEMLDALRAAVVSAGHDGKELKTAKFDIDTKYESFKVKDEWKKRFVGYTCSHGLRLEFDLDMRLLGETLGAISKCEANPHFNIRFTVKDPSAISEQLLESAVENAKHNAAVLARAAGVTLGEIQRIDYNWSEISIYSDTVYEMPAFMGKGHSKKTFADIEPEDIKASDTATIIWAIKE